MTCPSCFCISPRMADINDDLPQPTCPTTAIRRPDGTEMLMLQYAECKLITDNVPLYTTDHSTTRSSATAKRPARCAVSWNLSLLLYEWRKQIECQPEEHFQQHFILLPAQFCTRIIRLSYSDHTMPWVSSKYSRITYVVVVNWTIAVITRFDYHQSCWRHCILLCHHTITDKTIFFGSKASELETSRPAEKRSFQTYV